MKLASLFYKTIESFLILGLLRSIFTFYLMYSDPYFYNLEFTPVSFKKIYHFEYVTLLLPIIAVIIIQLIRLVQSKIKWIFEFSIGLTAAVIAYYFFDSLIKKQFVFFDNARMNVLVFLILDTLLLMLLSFQYRKSKTELNDSA